jgi:hypothetical protein
MSNGPDAEKMPSFDFYCHQVSNNYLVLPMECRNDWHLLKISISCQFSLFIPEFIHPNILLGLALTCLAKLAFPVKT